MKVGDILVCHWGYSMVLYNFAEVLKISPKTIKVRLLHTEPVGSEGYGRPKIAPVRPLQPIQWKNEKIELRLYPTKNNDGWFEKTNGYKKFYYPWDGEPKTEDHND